MTHDYQASHEFPEWAHELNLLGVWVINGLVGRKQTLITGLGDLPGRIKSCRGGDALLPSRAPPANVTSAARKRKQSSPQSGLGDFFAFVFVAHVLLCGFSYRGSTRDVLISHGRIVFGFV